MLQDIGVVRVAVKVEIDLGVVGTIDKNVDTLEIVAYVAVCVVGCGEVVDRSVEDGIGDHYGLGLKWMSYKRQVRVLHKRCWPYRSEAA